jgi:hypothetical protein
MERLNGQTPVTCFRLAGRNSSASWPRDEEYAMLLLPRRAVALAATVLGLALLGLTAVAATGVEPGSVGMTAYIKKADIGKLVGEVAS